MSKTVSGLLAHCRTALANKVQYIYGAKMQVMTLAQIKALQNIYGTSYVWPSDLQKAGRLCCDCSGLISSYTGIARSSSNYKAVAPKSVSISELKSNWNKYIGWAVWLQGHIGVVSDKKGYYYAMDGSGRNMVHNPMNMQNWMLCIQIKDINYNATTTEKQTTPEPKKEETKKEETDMLVSKTININGSDKNFTVNEINGKNYFPAEVLHELGIIVKYDANTKKVTLEDDVKLIDIKLNNDLVRVSAINIDGYNFIPLRTFEALGADVSYDVTNNLPIISTPRPTIIKTVINGKERNLDGLYVNGVNYVPIRTLELFNVTVDYNKESNTVVIDY